MFVCMGVCLYAVYECYVRVCIRDTLVVVRCVRYFVCARCVSNLRM